MQDIYMTMRQRKEKKTQSLNTYFMLYVCACEWFYRWIVFQCNRNRSRSFLQLLVTKMGKQPNQYFPLRRSNGRETMGKSCAQNAHQYMRISMGRNIKAAKTAQPPSLPPPLAAANMLCVQCRILWGVQNDVLHFALCFVGFRNSIHPVCFSIVMQLWLNSYCFKSPHTHINRNERMNCVVNSQNERGKSLQTTNCNYFAHFFSFPQHIYSWALSHSLCRDLSIFVFLFSWPTT